MQLASQLKPPQFNEEFDLWADFVWEWEEYWASLTDGGGAVSEGDKLKIFGQCLGKDLQDTTTYLNKIREQLHLSTFSPILSRNMGRKRVWG